MESVRVYMTTRQRREILTKEGKTADLARLDAADVKRARKMAKRATRHGITPTGDSIGWSVGVHADVLLQSWREAPTVPASTVVPPTPEPVVSSTP